MTGGGKNMFKPLDDVEQKSKDIIQLSVDGLPTIFDSDVNVDDITSKITVFYYECSFLLEYWS